MLPGLAAVEGNASAHIGAGFSSGVTEYGNILCTLGKQGFILDLIKLNADEGSVTADVLFLDKEIVGAEIGICSAAVGGCCEITLLILEVCSGIVGDGSVGVFDKSTLTGTYLNAGGGLPGLTVVVGIDRVVVSNSLKSGPVGVGTDTGTSRAEKSALILAVTELNTVSRAVCTAAYLVGLAVPVKLFNRSNGMLALDSGFAVIGGLKLVAGEHTFGSDLLAHLCCLLCHFSLFFGCIVLKLMS